MEKQAEDIGMRVLLEGKYLPGRYFMLGDYYIPVGQKPFFDRARYYLRNRFFEAFRLLEGNFVQEFPVEGSIGLNCLIYYFLLECRSDGRKDLADSIVEEFAERGY